MEKLSLADCLAELKRIDSILDKRFINIKKYSSKRRGSKDLIENQKDYVREQSQSARDLLTRYKNIKLAMQTANLVATFEYNGKTYSIAEAMLYKQYLHKKYARLYYSFSPDQANIQIDRFIRTLGGNITQEMAEKLDLVPEIFYNERHVEKESEDLLTLMSYIDKLIDKTNHSTYIEI